jgi:polyferredoxin
MDSIGYPRGLVRYSSERALAGGETRLLKFKNIGYGVAVLGAIALLSFSVLTRSTVDISVVQVRQPLAVTLSDGRIQNQYEVKIMNKTSAPAEFAVHITGLPEAQLDLGHFTELSVAAEASVRVVARVRMDPHLATQSKQPFEFVVERIDTDEVPPHSWQSVFYTPPEKVGARH